MPRVLVAIILLFILIGYYFFKQQVELQEEAVKKEIKKPKPVKKTKPKSVSKKKQDFYDLMIPALDEVYAQLEQQFEEINSLVQNDPTSPKITALKKKYNVTSNVELLMALKPHPKSIAIAQGAMESAWGTSRFYKVAYNIFGVWSFNKNDKRVAANENRGSQTIWLKKYDSVKESIADYYLTLSRSKAFKAFKRLNYEKANQNPYLLVKKLDRYSEKGALYGKELSSMISYNNLTQYDVVAYSKPVIAKKVEKLTPIKEETDVLIKQKELKEDLPAKVEEVKQKEVEKLTEVIDTVQENESSFGDVLKSIKE